MALAVRDATDVDGLMHDLREHGYARLRMREDATLAAARGLGLCRRFHSGNEPAAGSGGGAQGTRFQAEARQRSPTTVSWSLGTAPSPSPCARPSMPSRCRRPLAP